MLTIKRRGAQGFFFFYVPNLMLNVLTLVQFFLPCDSSERIKWSASIYLAVTFYLLSIKDVFPLSANLPVWVQFIALTAVLTGASQVRTFLTLTNSSFSYI